MSISDAILTAWENLCASKLRAVLTMLGMIIGVGAVIVMVSIVEGARTGIVREFEKLGSRLIVITYKPTAQERRRQRQAAGLSLRDVESLSARCPMLLTLSAETAVSADTSARRGVLETRSNMTGVAPEYAGLRGLRPVQGRFLVPSDLKEARKVCVLGTQVAATLFPGESAVGKTILASGQIWVVVGVLEKKGRLFEGDMDSAILIPITAAHKRLLGRDTVTTIWAQPRPAAPINAALNQVWEQLMRTRQNAPGYRVDSQESLLNAIHRTLTLFGLVLSSIAGLALLVGGVGIMNIMLVSVTERTREIGVRRAVGARQSDIVSQFLVEAGTLSCLGGMIGTAAGTAVAFVFSAFAPQLLADGGGIRFQASVPLWAVLGAFVFSAAIGVFFGSYPAVRAARLDPIAALRHQ